MSSEEKLSQTGRKTADYWCKIFLLKHILRFEYKEKCLSKLSIKIFTKRSQSMEGLCLPNASELLVTCNFFKNSLQTTVSVVKQLLSDVTQFFCQMLSMSTANIQAWTNFS